MTPEELHDLRNMEDDKSPLTLGLLFACAALVIVGLGLLVWRVM